MRPFQCELFRIFPYALLVHSSLCLDLRQVRLFPQHRQFCGVDNLFFREKILPGFHGSIYMDVGKILDVIQSKKTGDNLLKILWAYKAACQELAELPEFPVRMDEMTEQEAKIASIACEVTGTMQYIQRNLEDALTDIRCEVTKNPKRHRYLDGWEILRMFQLPAVAETSRD